jgi:CBS domain-containing protein
VTAAFYFIQMLRLRQQMNPATPAGAANRVDPDKLNPMERQLLKESFRQAQKVQAKLKLAYAL